MFSTYTRTNCKNLSMVNSYSSEFVGVENVVLELCFGKMAFAEGCSIYLRNPQEFDVGLIDGGTWI